MIVAVVFENGCAHIHKVSVAHDFFEGGRAVKFTLKAGDRVCDLVKNDINY